MSYFEAKGVANAFAAKQPLVTVPARWPEDFDWVFNRP
jgi:hypothetical protein